MEEVTVSLSVSLARQLERLSTDHGPGYMDHLLDTCRPYVESDTDTPEPLPIDEWIPKIGIDAVNKSVEIDVGSQVVVVNLADFYKKRDSAQLLGSRADGGAATDAAASGLHLLAATATQESVAGSGPRFTCVLCHALLPTQVALRVHGASAHCARLSACRRCGLSFLSQRELDRHPCEEERRQRQEQRERQEQQERLERQRVPPLVVRPPKSGRVRRLEDTSSDDDSDEAERPVPRRRSPPPQPPPPPPRPVARRPLPPPAGPPRRPAPPNGKKEAYVCRVCHSKFRDPKSVLNHLKEFHPEHARKAWNKFQDNLKSRQVGSGPPRPPATAAAAGRGGGGGSGDSTFAVRSVAPMKLKLSRSQQQQRMQHPPPRRPPSPPAPSSEPAGPPSPGFVTCGVCGGTKYYTHTARCRLDGSYACESCRKFIGRLPPHQPVQCLLGLGRCHIPAVAPRHTADARCRACWLKKCLAAFNMPPERHDRMRALLPPSIARDVPEAAHKAHQQRGRCELDEG